MTNDLQRTFGRNLRAHREARGISQEAFAQLVGVHHSYISDIERGIANITLITLERFSAAAGLEPLDLLAELPED